MSWSDAVTRGVLLLWTALIAEEGGYGNESIKLLKTSSRSLPLVSVPSTRAA